MGMWEPVPHVEPYKDLAYALSEMEAISGVGLSVNHRGGPSEGGEGEGGD